jgi:hypothetical protein
MTTASIAAEHPGDTSPQSIAAPLLALRRLPLRNAQPPFDDEVRPSPADHWHGALTLAFALPGGVAAVPDLPEALRDTNRNDAPRLRLVPPISGATRRRPRDVAEQEFGPLQTPRVALPDPTPWAGRLVQALIEVVAGVRPAPQLVRWTTTEVYESVQRKALRSAHESRTGAPRRIAEIVRSLHVSEPGDGIAEVCAVVQQGPRCRAIALRLEGLDGRWQCTALQIG